MQAGSRAPFILADSSIPLGSRALVDIPFGKLYTHTELNIGAHVIHGRKDGPVLLITAALHGDEINGVEICRRLLKLPRLSQLKGTLIVVPIVNTYGFVQQSRYLPDRRDLNRSFPGSEKGSLGSRMAYQFTEQVLRTCTHAIDLHTGAIHRANLPQVRASAKDKTALRMAEVFNAPIIIKAASRDGTMRGTANTLGIPILLYEAGEFLQVQEYTHVQRWAEELAQRPAVQRGRMVNRVMGAPESQLHERHDAADFETQTQDKKSKSKD